MNIEVLGDHEAASRRAARLLAGWIAGATAARERCVVALSGGSTPGRTFQELARADVPWSRVHLFQVDERVAPAGNEARNLPAIREAFAAAGPVLHPMPVEAADLEAAARRHADELSALAGVPPVIDIVHLGLGADGHVASLVPGDPVLEITDRAVAVTGPYRGHRRMTLTLPTLNRARRRLWLVTGEGKAAALERFLAGDRSIPAGRVRAESTWLVTDRAC